MHRVCIRVFCLSSAPAAVLAFKRREKVAEKGVGAPGRLDSANQGKCKTGMCQDQEDRRNGGALMDMGRFLIGSGIRPTARP